MVLLLSPLATAWFLSDDVIAIYGPTVMALSLLLYLIDPNRDQVGSPDGNVARPHLRLHPDGRSVVLLIVFMFVAVIGFFGSVGAAEDGWNSWLFGFGAACLLGITGMGWVMKRILSLREL